MGKIVVLDDNMINMIAAGEVIERPASVVRELMENSIDAGADRIAVQVEEGGRECIRVIDNGGGMGPEDLALAVEPHTTSKVRTEQDLWNITTLGFRGEALASIAAVSRMTVTSRVPDSIQAHCLEVDCGQNKTVRPSSGAVGTTIEVRRLFYKLPARRKFLRSANTEMGHVSEQFTRIALAHPELDLTLEHGSRSVYRLPAGGSIRERLKTLFGSVVSEDLIEVEREDKQIRIVGLIGQPETARTSAKYQYIFLNGRFIRDKFILHAVREAYRGLTEPNKYPVVFLFLRMPPDRFDVNVHPTKTEVRFENSNWVYSQVLSALRDRLLSMDLKTTGRFPSGASDFADGDNPLESLLQKGRSQRIHEAMEDFFESHAAGQSRQGTFSFPTPRPSAPRSFDGGGSVRGFAPPTVPSMEPFEPAAVHCLQIHSSYLLVQTEDGFEVIDQHALHERILYEKMRARLEQGPLAAQRLLVPPSVEVTESEQALLEQNADLLEKLGIELTPFGPGVLAVQSFPVLLEKADPAEFLRDLLDLLSDRQLSVDAEKLVHHVLDRAACKAAIKAGEPLTEDEIGQLLKDREQTLHSSRCPHGRPTSIRFPLKDLEKQFKRTGF
jgi:DNA mismatch repair protein MutL